MEIFLQWAYIFFNQKKKLKHFYFGEPWDLSNYTQVNTYALLIKPCIGKRLKGLWMNDEVGLSIPACFT